MELKVTQLIMVTKVLVDNDYMLFATESEYYEYINEREETKNEYCEKVQQNEPIHISDTKGFRVCVIGNIIFKERCKNCLSG